MKTTCKIRIFLARRFLLGCYFELQGRKRKKYFQKFVQIMRSLESSNCNATTTKENLSMNVVNEYGEKRNGFTEVVVFCHVTCRYFDRFLLQGVDRNWRQAWFFYLAPGLICEGYWQVNSRRSIFRIGGPYLMSWIVRSY